MNKIIYYISIVCCIAVNTSCEDDIRNIAGESAINTIPDGTTNPYSSEVNPVDINIDGFDFLDKMKGHWVGNNLVISDIFEWFAWDYRPISESHIHGIFEGGSMGNLLTSFFVTDYKGKRTIMARNGGLLNGIYRTSYFVMDKVENRDDGSKYYRLVDAKGGAALMSMELRFKQESLYFNSYTSNLGSRIPSRHMTCKAKKMHTELAETAALATNYPQNTPAWDFSGGLNNLYIAPGETEPRSATYLAQGAVNDVFQLAIESLDPWRIDQHPRLGYLQVDITDDPAFANAQAMLVYLSRDPLTDANGFFSPDFDVYDTILLYPTLTEGESQFLFTYLHPGNYYVNITADMDGDGAISIGDITHPQQMITIDSEGQHQITINNINVQN